MSISVSMEGFAGIPDRDVGALHIMLAGLLERAKAPKGQYKARLKGKGMGTPSQQGMARVKVRAVRGRTGIDMRAQAGANDTCFDFYLCAPSGVDLTKLRALLTDTVSVLRRDTKAAPKQEVCDTIGARVRELCRLLAGEEFRAADLGKDLLHACGWDTNKKTAISELKEAARMVRLTRDRFSFMGKTIEQVFPKGVPFHGRATTEQVVKARSVLSSAMTATLKSTMELLASEDTSRQLTRVKGRKRACVWWFSDSVFDMLDSHERGPVVEALLDSGVIVADPPAQNGNAGYTIHTLLLEHVLDTQADTSDMVETSDPLPVEKKPEEPSVTDGLGLEQQLHQIKESLDKLQQDRKSAMARRDSDHESLLASKAERDAAKEAFERAQRDVQRAQGRFNMADTALSRLTDRIKQLQSEYEDISAQFAAYNSRKVDGIMEDLKSRLSPAELGALKDKLHAV